MHLCPQEVLPLITVLAFVLRWVANRYPQLWD